MKDRYHDIYLQIGLNILRCRKEWGLTQEQLADRTGHSRNHIQRVETAYTAPTLATLLDIAQALEVPLEKLLEIPK